jgi:hypothetical protein
MENALVAMDRSDRTDPSTWPLIRAVEGTVEQLKKALFDKTDSAIIQRLLKEITTTIRGGKSGMYDYYAWHDVLAPNKALLIGNAESAARVVDLEVQNLTKRGKSVPAQLQAQHANARTNIHLVKDFLYPLEQASRHLRPDEMVEGARRNK